LTASRSSKPKKVLIARRANIKKNSLFPWLDIRDDIMEGVSQKETPGEAPLKDFFGMI
jgi:hypothetical protein